MSFEVPKKSLLASKLSSARTNPVEITFDKYEKRLQSIGVRLPEAIRGKIVSYLKG